MEPPKSSSILHKSSDIRKPIRRVKIYQSRGTSRIHSRPKSFARIYFVNLVSAAPTLQNLRIGLRKRQWQEQGAREAAWKLAKNVLKLKEQGRATFFSTSEYRCLLASNLKPEEREFVVDFGASMHMINRKDLNSVELETVTTSRCPTTVITANGEVQTHDEATVYVKELEIFLTMNVLDFSRITEIHMSGPLVKTISHQKRCSDTM